MCRSNFFKSGTLAIAFLFCFGFSVYSQNKDQLEKQKKEALKHIAETEKVLSQTTQKKSASLGQLRALNQQVEAMESLISSITKEISLITKEISENQMVIEALEHDLTNLKKEYASMVYAAYKTRNSSDRLSFIFSSESFMQLIMRLKYLEQYTESRKKQVELINQVRDELIANKSALELNISDKQKLLNDQLKEKKKLDNLKSQQSNMVAELQKQESKLKQDIEKNKKDIAKLDNLIADLVKKEMDAGKVAPKTTTVDLKKLSNSFEENKSNLPWPVSNGFISEKFGTNPHPLLKRVQVPNNGVNIQTRQNEKVRAVFNGKVKRIAIIPGDLKYVVIVQHGEYYTVYASIKEVYVKVGQDVKTNDVIGEVNTLPSGDAEVHFEVWKNTEKLNPEIWLAKK